MFPTQRVSVKLDPPTIYWGCYLERCLTSQPWPKLPKRYTQSLHSKVLCTLVSTTPCGRKACCSIDPFTQSHRHARPSGSNFPHVLSDVGIMRCQIAQNRPIVRVYRQCHIAKGYHTGCSRLTFVTPVPCTEVEAVNGQCALKQLSHRTTSSVYDCSTSV